MHTNLEPGQHVTVARLDAELVDALVVAISRDSLLLVDLDADAQFVVTDAELELGIVELHS